MADTLSSSAGMEAKGTPEKRGAAPSTPSTAEGRVLGPDETQADAEFGERDEDGVESDCSSSEGGEVEEDEDDEKGEAEQEEEEESPEEAAERARQAEMTRRQRILNFVEQMQHLRAKTQGSRSEAAAAEKAAAATQEEPRAAEEAAGEASAQDDKTSVQADKENSSQGSNKADEDPAKRVDEAAGHDASMRQKLLKMQAMLNAMKAAKDPDEELYKAHVAGSDRYDEGDFGASVEAWSEVLRLKPGDVDAWSRRGQARAKLGDTDKAMADFAEALRLDPDRADIWFSRASARSDAGDDEGAMADFEESLKRDDQQPDVWCCRGTLRLEMGDIQGAIDDCSEALDADANHAGAWGLRGTARHRLGDHRSAVEDCKRALDIDPDLDWVKPTLEAARRAAGAGGSSGSKKEAVKSPDPTSWRAYGNNLFREGSFKEAAAAYGAAASSGEDGWVLALSNQALCHLRMGENDKAVEAAERCLQEKDAPFKVHFTKFKALAALREWEKAFAALDALRALPGLPQEIAAVADQEEKAKRQEQETLMAAE